MFRYQCPVTSVPSSPPPSYVIVGGAPINRQPMCPHSPQSQWSEMKLKHRWLLSALVLVLIVFPATVRADCQGPVDPTPVGVPPTGFSCWQIIIQAVISFLGW